MAQTKTGFITLTDISDGSIGVDGTAYITHTAYQNYVPGTSVDLPTTVSIGTDGVLDNDDLVPSSGWVITPTAPTGSSSTFFTKRIFKLADGDTAFTGQDVWSPAVRLTGDDGRPGDPGVANTGRYSDLQTTGGFNTDGTGARWKIRTDGDTNPTATPDASGGVDVWDDSVNVLFLSSIDEDNTAAISDYYGTLGFGDLGRLQTNAAPTASANIPAFCTLPGGGLDSTPFICDSPAGYVIFELQSAPVRMTPAGVVSDTGGVWRMEIDTVRADTAPTLEPDSTVVANFGYNKVVQGADGLAGDAGSRGPGRFDISITLPNNNAAPDPGAADDLFNGNARRTICEALNGTWTTSCSLALGIPIAGDIIVITYTSLDGNTVSTKGAIHDGFGTGFGNWSGFAVQIDGSLLVQGTVVADALAVDSVTAAAINVTPGQIGVGSNAASGSRMVITGDRIKIYEGDTLRVVLGNLNPE